MAETFSKTVRRGGRGRDVRLAQEWLSFHGFATAIDGAFGPATEACVQAFQSSRGLSPSGAVNPKTQEALLAPAFAVEAPIPAAGLTLGELVVAYARQHLQQHPIEIGGQNAGPWVRLYMGGREGPQWPWCAGFATFVLRLAARTLGVAMPHPYAFGCDYLAGVAQGNGRFLRPKDDAARASVRPGYLFLVRRTSNDWTHIGIVDAVQGPTIVTIEGNTNDSGSAEGFEVCRRTRSLDNRDFLIV